MKKILKPLIVMLSIILICGGLLAILSDVLKVSDEERIQRAIDKIYNDKEVTLDSVINLDSYDMTEYEEFGIIKACYKLNNADLLILSTGKKGYSNGTVTNYVAIDSSLTVKKVVQDSYKGQTLMSKLGSIFSQYENLDENTSKNDFDSIVVSGASYSSYASSNSVYVALQLAKKIGGQI